MTLELIRPTNDISRRREMFLPSVYSKLLLRAPSKIELDAIHLPPPSRYPLTLTSWTEDLTHPFRRTQLCDSRRTDRASRPTAGLAHSCLPGVTSADACCTLVVAVLVPVATSSFSGSCSRARRRLRRSLRRTLTLLRVVLFYDVTTFRDIPVRCPSARTGMSRHPLQGGMLSRGCDVIHPQPARYV